MKIKLSKLNFVSIIFSAVFLTACQSAEVAKAPFANPAVKKKSGLVYNEGAPYYWVEEGIRGNAILRTISEGGGTCPALKVGSSSIPLYGRAAITKTFPSQICELGLKRKPSGVWTTEKNPNEATVPISEVPSYILDFDKIPLPKSRITRIAVMGDTGCRVKVNEKGAAIQGCGDKNSWPFASLANSMAQENPELVIHVGDYHYRESACPVGHPECQGITSGDVANSWMEDFILPADPLLKTAPFIFVRGNHEDCNRSKEGWMRFLDPHPYTANCVNNIDPYLIPMGSVVLAVIDATDETNIQRSLDILSKNKTLENQKLWILTHRPFLTETKLIKNKIKTKIPKNMDVGVVIAGHIHILSLNRFNDNRPLEFIVGASGTALDKFPKEDPDFVSFDSFGYLTIDLVTQGEWKVRIHDQKGQVISLCQMNEDSHKKSFLACVQKTP